MIRTLLSASLAALLAVAAPASAKESQPDRPTYGPRLEGYNYPFPVRTYAFNSQRQPLEMTYMDVAPTGPANGRTALLLHGKNFCAATWAPTIRVLAQAGFRVIAVDQIGFCKASKPADYQFSLPQLATNTKGLLDSLNIDRAVIVGHSMGAFTAVVLANLFPERVRSLVLVDGGLPLQVPPGLSDEQIVAAVLGPAAERLHATFPTREVYRSFWKQHPAFSAGWSPVVEGYVDSDLTGEEPVLRPATRYQAMADDTAELHRGASLLKALDELAVETLVLRAPRGLLNEPGGLYAPGYLDNWAEKLPALTVREIPDVNHYTIIMGAPGAAAVADTVREALAVASWPDSRIRVFGAPSRAGCSVGGIPDVRVQLGRQSLSLWPGSGRGT